ncbi:MAG: RNA polymerase sigma-70 factor [Sphingobacteriales bacterium]|nr:RNA polymerase sigma-70 factor [Sphingobacteriales bacterium]OJV98799.1 MAG: RNA polymerase subunit sigma-70 [Sphingobacteriales bacterium 44-61]
MKTCETLSDNELLLLLQKDNHTAFTEIYNRFKGLLIVHAYNKLNNRDEAKDIVQELFATVWDNRRELQIRETLSGYLYTAIRNRVIKYISRKKSERHYLETLNKVVEANNSPTDYLVREHQLSKLIEDEIDQLPSKMKACFLLSRKHNLSHREIAEELGISELTVKKQVANALKVLRTKLGLFAYIIMLIRY